MFTVLHAVFPSLPIPSQTSPLSHYNLFSMLMLCTQLFCPFLPWPLCMQIISVAFLYLFSWYLPSLLHAKLIPGSPCLFIEPFGRICVYSVLCLLRGICQPFSTTVNIINNYKMGNWWPQRQFSCWITSCPSSSSVICTRFVSVMSFLASFGFFSSDF